MIRDDQEKRRRQKGSNKKTTQRSEEPTNIELAGTSRKLMHGVQTSNSEIVAGYFRTSSSMILSSESFKFIHRHWGRVKQSYVYHFLVSSLAILPLVDVGTDYAFVIIFFADVDRTSQNYQFQMIMSIITTGLLFLSSRLAIAMYLEANTKGQLLLTPKNMLIIYITGACRLIFLDNETLGCQNLPSVCNYFLRILGSLVYFLLIPLSHLALVVFCCIRQVQWHCFTSKDVAHYPDFAGLSVLELFESVPQVIMQNILFINMYGTLNTTWKEPHRIYVFSTLISVVSIIKAVWLYYRRYEVIIKSLGKQRSIADKALATEHLRNLDFFKLQMVLRRMYFQRKDLYNDFWKSVKIEQLLDYLFGCDLDEIKPLLRLGLDINGGYRMNIHEEVVNPGEMNIGIRLSIVKSPDDSPDGIGEKENIPILIAACKDCRFSIEFLEMFKNLGADLDVKNEDGLTLLSIIHESYVTRLVKLGADVERQDNRVGFTPLIYACITADPYSPRVQFLIDSRANLEARDNEGQTALMWAAMYEKREHIRTLVWAKANLDARTHEGLTALMLLSTTRREEHVHMVQYLYENGADLEVPDSYGRTVILHACAEGSNAMIDKLVDLGADLNVRDKNNVPAENLIQNRPGDLYDSLQPTEVPNNPFGTFGFNLLWWCGHRSLEAAPGVMAQPHSDMSEAILE